MKYSFRGVVGIFFIFSVGECVNTLDAKKIVFAEQVTAAAGTYVRVEEVEGGREEIFENDHLLGKYFQKIFRADRFSDGEIKRNFINGTLNKIFSSFKSHAINHGIVNNGTRGSYIA